MRIDGYVGPDKRTGGELNPLGGMITVDVEPRGSYHVAATMILPAEDLAQFATALADIDRHLAGEAILGRDPDYFQVTVRMDRGKGTIEGIVYDAGAELTFGEIETDQTFIREALAQFRALATAFPVR